MTLEIIHKDAPTEFVSVVRAEHNPETETAMIELNGPVLSLVPDYEEGNTMPVFHGFNVLRCEHPRSAVLTLRGKIKNTAAVCIDFILHM